MVLNAINDIVELQNAKLIFSDTPHGKINFVVKMYTSRWEHRFTVTGIDVNKCSVRLELGQESPDSESQIKREFALLDSMLMEEDRTQ